MNRRTFSSRLVGLFVLAVSMHAVAAGPTGKVFDHESGSLSVELRGYDGRSMGVHLGSIRRAGDNAVVVYWFYAGDKGIDADLITQFTCPNRQATILQANGVSFGSAAATHTVLPRSNEELVMDYVCQREFGHWWEIWK